MGKLCSYWGKGLKQQHIKYKPLFQADLTTQDMRMYIAGEKTITLSTCMWTLVTFIRNINNIRVAKYNANIWYIKAI